MIVLSVRAGTVGDGHRTLAALRASLAAHVGGCDEDKGLRLACKRFRRSIRSTAGDVGSCREELIVSGTNHAKKKAVRARMAATGESYTTAYRALTEATESVSARAVWEHPSPGRDRPLSWTITVDDPRQSEPITCVVYPAGPFTALLDQHLDAAGWRRAPRCSWPNEDVMPADVDLVLERSDVGRRNDEAQAALDAVGRKYHDVHELYLAAVAHSLTRAGIGWEDYHANPDEPRDGAILLSEPLPGDEELHVAWREDMGWYCIPSSDAQSALGDAAIDLPGPLPLLAEPHEVAAAVRKVVGGLTVDAEPLWHPPADYDRDAEPAEEWWDANPALERSLAAYATHPANSRTPRCEGCGMRAAHFVVTVDARDDPRADDGVRTGMVCELCDTEDALTRRRVQLSDLPSRG